MIRIRDAVIEDLPTLLVIYNHCVRTSAATFDLAEQSLAQRSEWFSHYGGVHPLIVAEIDKKVVAYGSLSPFRTKPAYDQTVESSVYVHSEDHGKGIGKALMKELLRRASELGHHVVVAGITAGNDVSVQLHESLGFQYMGRFREVGLKFGKWQDVLFYQLLLSDNRSNKRRV